MVEHWNHVVFHMACQTSGVFHMSPVIYVRNLANLTNHLTVAGIMGLTLDSIFPERYLEISYCA